ncbi:MAG: hypothetical protein F6K42_05265 [Leptolyngbya sp. SIO1D8]|nr:hypothetical protein [Leptolyngbya sp. SIO1D8]
MSATTPLPTACTQYHQQIEALKQSTQWTEKGVIAMLRQRDRIQQLINDLAQQPHPPVVHPQVWLDLSQADAQLGQWSDKLLATSSLNKWRKTLNPPPHHWWWHIEEPEPQKESKPFLDWLWSGLTLAAIPIILALAKDISTRFLTDAPGFWSSIGLVLPAALGLFAAGGALTKVGNQIIESVLSAKIASKRFFPLVKFGLAAMLLLSLLAFHIWGLPWAANRYYNLGNQQYFDEEQLTKAQSSSQQALKLQPDHPAAQHLLALTYENLRDFDQAKAEYAKAVSAGYVKSFNNLARLYLFVDDDPETAAVLLLRALEDENRDRTDKDLDYTIRKNLGWAYLKQRRYLEAQSFLNQAIALEGELERTWPDAHCLLAQTLEAQNQEGQAERELCRRYIELPEDDIWAKYLNQVPEEDTADDTEPP